MEGSSAAHRFHQPLSSHCSEVFFVITTAPRMVGGPGSSAEVVLMGRGIFNAVSDKVAVVVPGGRLRDHRSRPRGSGRLRQGLDFRALPRRPHQAGAVMPAPAGFVTGIAPQNMCWPPLIDRLAPVTKQARSVQR